MFPRLFSIGPVTVYSYGAMVFLAIIAAWGILKKETRNVIPPSKLEDTVFYSVLAGFLGARIFYFLFWDFKGLTSNPLNFFYIWQGGLAIAGGIFGGGASLYFYSRKLKIKYLTLLDYFAAPLALGQAIGRIGCLLAGCCYGRPSGGLPGICFHESHSLAPLGVKLFPTQIMESAADFVLFLILIKMKKEKAGKTAAVYIAGYAAIRFFMEFFRGDTVAGLDGLTAMQIIAIICVFFVIILKYARKI